MVASIAVPEMAHPPQPNPSPASRWVRFSDLPTGVRVSVSDEFDGCVFMESPWVPSVREEKSE